MFDYDFKLDGYIPGSGAPNWNGTGNYHSLDSDWPQCMTVSWCFVFWLFLFSSLLLPLSWDRSSSVSSSFEIPSPYSTTKNYFDRSTFYLKGQFLRLTTCRQQSRRDGYLLNCYSFNSINRNAHRVQSTKKKNW